ncbi:hypothetical protein AMS68_006626 [Peltaster fructicola]|uniref:G domain-containing protein n=1 Tax=Peltaster fructicola TaxID=286661 RepID=A0A6H0Y2N3_9PEZI|nr:hypothetical protein AMS68_006626 [Peltaster fructicola]
MVVGMPNVGKSSLLNALRQVGVGKGKAARTGAQPGITRAIARSGVKIVSSEEDSGNVYLVDTPGVFIPYVPDAEAMLKLALCGSVKDTIISPTILADYLLFQINRRCPQVYGEFHRPTNEIMLLLEAIAIKTGRLAKAGAPDTEAAALWFIQKWREGLFGRFMLDEVTKESLTEATNRRADAPLSLSQARKASKELARQKSQKTPTLEADSSIATSEPTTTTKRRYSQGVEEQGSKRRRLSVEENEQSKTLEEATVNNLKTDSNHAHTTAVDVDDHEQTTAVAGSDHNKAQAAAQTDAITEPQDGQTEPAVEQRPKHVSSAVRKPEGNEGILPPRRKTGVAVDEKQRSRRLFGSILGTIGQRSDRTAKKRQEIEARTQAESKQHDAALNEDRSLRQKRTAERRKQEQWHVDEADMNIRHRNMRHSANFLQTRARPVLHYRPWDLRPDEEQRIAQQKEDVERRVDAEISNFDRRRANSSSARRPSATDSQESTTVAGDQAADEEAKERPPEDTVMEDRHETLGAAKEPDVPATDMAAVETAGDEINGKQAALPDAEVSAESTGPPVKVGELDDGHMVEGDEDNVIY